MHSIIPSLKHVDSFTVTGLTVRTQNSDESNAEKALLPGLWQQFHASDLANKTNIFEVYSDYESDVNGFYSVTVGATDPSQPSEFSTVEVQSGNYLVFEAEGPMPMTVIETWGQIWAYFAENSDYKRSFVSDFEAYIGPGKVAIYIGVLS